LPKLFVVVVAVIGPVIVTVAAVPPAVGLIVPEMLKLAAGVDEPVFGPDAEIPAQAIKLSKRKTRHAISRTVLALKFFGFTETLRRGVKRLAPIH
jgi:ABC-type cobalamin transport system permease subunit